MTLIDPDRDFKVAIFFDIEYLRKDTRQSHSYYRTSIGSHALYGMVIFSMTLTDPQPGFQGHGIFEV